MFSSSFYGEYVRNPSSHIRAMGSQSMHSSVSKNRLDVNPKVVASENFREALEDANSSVNEFQRKLLVPIMAHKF